MIDIVHIILLILLPWLPLNNETFRYTIIFLIFWINHFYYIAYFNITLLVNMQIKNVIIQNENYVIKYFLCEMYTLLSLLQKHLAVLFQYLAILLRYLHLICARTLFSNYNQEDGLERGLIHHWKCIKNQKCIQLQTINSCVQANYNLSATACSKITRPTNRQRDNLI